MQLARNPDATCSSAMQWKEKEQQVLCGLPSFVLKQLESWHTQRFPLVFVSSHPTFCEVQRGKRGICTNERMGPSMLLRQPGACTTLETEPQADPTPRAAPGGGGSVVSRSSIARTTASLLVLRPPGRAVSNTPGAESPCREQSRAGKGGCAAQLLGERAGGPLKSLCPKCVCAFFFLVSLSKKIAGI